MGSSSATCPHTASEAELNDECHLPSKPTLCCHEKQQRPESPQCKDASKRKRVNRTAKLKHYKRDARREQWLSQGFAGKQLQRQNICSPTSQGKRTDSGEGEDKQPVLVALDSDHHKEKDQNCSCITASSWGAVCEPFARKGNYLTARSHLQIKRPEGKLGCADGKLGCADGGSMRKESVQAGANYETSTASTMSCVCDCSEADSSPKSCEDKSPKSKITKFGRPFESGRASSNSQPGKKLLNRSTKREDTENSGDVPWSIDAREPDFSGSSNASTCNSGSGSEGNNHSHDSEDDWEAAADALDLQLSSSGKGPRLEQVDSNVVNSDRFLPPERVEDNESTGKLPKPDCNNRASATREEKFRNLSRKAWRPEDSSRPSSLPILAKQQNLAAKHNNQACASTQKATWVLPPAPSHCPICTEELDSTDSSFIPCLCGFRLCLFCHHRIKSEDGRCPGCREPYDSDVAMKLSCSQSISRRV